MKEWKYRFKRGLASFLTVGMIASGVSGTACLPVYAVEQTADTVSEEEKAAIQQISAALAQQIRAMFDNNRPITGEETTEFQVSITLKNHGRDENEKLVNEIAKNEEIITNVSEACPSELFWYDSKSGGFEGSPYSCQGIKRTLNSDSNTFTATFEIKLAVKEIYQPEKSSSCTSISIEKIRDKVSPVEDADLKEAINELYGGLSKEISNMFEDKKLTEKDKFTVRLDCKNENMRKQLQESIKGIVERLCRECSSELFWYNQSYDKLAYGSYNWSDSYNDDTGRIGFTFEFAVKEKYQAGENTQIYVPTIQSVKKKVDGILVTEEGMSDYEILCQYRNTLYKEYSNYKDQFAEAFKYLCDQTKFSSGTRCSIITGKIKMDEKDAGQDHTWNIVNIGGQNYLVDLENYCNGQNIGFFLVGAQGSKDEYTIANGGITYIPESGAQSEMPSDLKYLQDQADFKIVYPVEGNLSCTVGEKDLEIVVEGNVPGSKVSFKSSNETVATVTAAWGDQNQKRALVHMLKAGTVEISAIASKTDNHAEKVLTRKITITGNTGNPGGNTGGSSGNTGGNPGGNTGGSSGNSGGNTGNTGGSSSGIGFGGGNTSGSGGSGRIGSVAVGEDSASKGLLPQTDFGINSGSSIILKSVGDEDFTITASGEVKDSKITYSSSDPSVATVDVNTGTVHIVGPGTVTISATASQTDLHRAEKCEYKVEVS